MQLPSPSRAAGSGALYAQLALAAAAVAALALMPPSRGRILLVPLAGGDAGAPARIALAHGARLIGAGAIPGSLVVFGEARSLGPSALAAGILSLRASAGGCAPERR